MHDLAHTDYERSHKSYCKLAQVDIDGPDVRRVRISNFASWPEIVQAIAAVSVRQIATARVGAGADLWKLGLLHRGDTTIPRRLLRL